MYVFLAANPEAMIISSFAQFQQDVGSPDRQAQLDALHSQMETISVPQEQLVADYYHITKQIDSLNEILQRYLTRPAYCLPFLQPGRMVEIVDGTDKWGWGLVVSFQKRKQFKVTAFNMSLSAQY